MTADLGPATTPTPRPVPTQEQRMRDARTDHTSPSAEAARVDSFNILHSIGTPVRYWKGVREGDGKVSRTRTVAQLLGGHTAVVWLENVSGCIALTHVEPITEEEFTATPAEQWPAAVTGRSFRTYLDRTERDQLDARAATAEQERDDALDDRDAYREARDVLRKQLDTARADIHRDIARQLDILAADPGILRDWLTTCDPMPTSFGELFHALAEKLRRDDTPRLGSPSPRAQEPTPGDARRLLDQAIDTALPLAGLRVAELLDALRRELARVDAGRAQDEPRACTCYPSGFSPGTYEGPMRDCPAHGEQPAEATP